MRLSASKMTIAFAKGPPSNKKTAGCFDSAQQSCSSTSIKASKNFIAILVAKVTKGHTFLLNQTLSPRIPERSRRGRHQTKKQQDASTALSSPAHPLLLKHPRIARGNSCGESYKRSHPPIKSNAFAKGPPSNKKTAGCFDSAQQSCSSTSIKASKNFIAILVAKVTQSTASRLSFTFAQAP